MFGWWKRYRFKRGWFAVARFKPCGVYNEHLRLTEIILEDTSIVWCPWGPYKGHAVDCGYSFDGRLVGIQIWDDVRERPSRDEEMASATPASLPAS